VTSPDFEITTLLRADSLTSHAAPDVHTTSEGDGVTVARRQTRLRVPPQLEAGVEYENVYIENRLTGENLTLGVINFQPRPAPVGAPLSGHEPVVGTDASTLSTASEQRAPDCDCIDRMPVETRIAERARRRRNRASRRQQEPTRLSDERRVATVAVRDATSASEISAKLRGQTSHSAAVGVAAVAGLLVGVLTAIKLRRRRICLDTAEDLRK